MVFGSVVEDDLFELLVLQFAVPQQPVVNSASPVKKVPNKIMATSLLSIPCTKMEPPMINRATLAKFQFLKSISITLRLYACRLIRHR